MGRQPVSPMYLLVKGNEQDSLAFQYNPSEVTTTLSVKYDDNKVPGRPAVTPQYAHTSPRVVSFTLFLNEYYDHQGELVEGVVENTISWLQSKCWPKMRYKNHVEVSDTREYSEAPDVLMLLGPVQGVFECYLTDLTINRSIYADKWISDRHPHAAIRAKVDITLRERFEPLKSPIHNGKTWANDRLAGRLDRSAARPCLTPTSPSNTLRLR
jgi:hypothetical protein